MKKLIQWTMAVGVLVLLAALLVETSPNAWTAVSTGPGAGGSSSGGGGIFFTNDGTGQYTNQWPVSLVGNDATFTNLTVVSNLTVEQNLIVKNGATVNIFSVTNSLDVTNYFTSWDIFMTNGLETITHSNNTAALPSVGLALSNKVVATVGSQKVSPSIVFGGNGWKTTSTAASQPVNTRIGAIPIEAATSPKVMFRLETSTNNASYKTIAEWDSDIGQTNANAYLVVGSKSGNNPIILIAPEAGSVAQVTTPVNQMRVNGATSVTLATAGTDRFSFTSSEFQALAADYDLGTPSTYFRAFFHKNYINKSADTTVTDASMVSSGLSSSLTTTRRYSIECVLFVTNTVAADGIKVDFDGGTCTATLFRMHTVIYHDSGIAVQAWQNVLATDVVAATMTGAGTVVCHGYIDVNGSGTFIPRISENTDGGGTLTCLKGSYYVMQTLINSP